MYPMIDYNKKFIIGWSAKCACTSLKKWFLKENNINYLVNGEEHHNQIIGAGDTNYSKLLPLNTYKDFKKVLVIRNPFTRAFSAYNFCFGLHLKESHKWVSSFDIFINEIFYNGFKNIYKWKHHYTPQTTELFYLMHKFEWDRVLEINELKNWDEINNFLGTKTKLKNENKLDETKWPTPEINSDIKNKILKIYEQDFIYFSKLGYIFDWKITKN